MFSSCGCGPGEEPVQEAHQSWTAHETFKEYFDLTVTPGLVKPARNFGVWLPDFDVLKLRLSHQSHPVSQGYSWVS